MASKSPRNIQPLSCLGIFLDLTRTNLDRRNRKNDLVSISFTISYEKYFSNTLTTMKVAKSRAMSRTELFFFEIFLIWGLEKLSFLIKKTSWTLRNAVIISKKIKLIWRRLSRITTTKVMKIKIKRKSKIKRDYYLKLSDRWPKRKRSYDLVNFPE